MEWENPYFGFRKDRAKIYDLWERFNDGLLEIESLKDPYQRMLVEEWHRCSTLRVDPCKKLGVRVSDDELRIRAETSRQFFDAARAGIARIADSLTDVPGILVVSDDLGVVLDISGNNKVRVLAAERTGIVEGSCWLESIAGTNGLGTAISKRQPVHVYSSEHYCEGWHAWTCAATPIVAPGRKQLYGVINFTTIDKDYRDQALALSCSLASAIQASLRLDEQLQHNFLTQQFQKYASRYPADTLLAVDVRGNEIRRSPGVTDSDAARAKHLQPKGVREKIDLVMPGTGYAAGSIYLLDAARGKKSTGRQQQPGNPEDPAPAAPITKVIEPRAPIEVGPQELSGDILADYQLIFDNTIVGICYTRDRVAIRCNRRLEEMFGYAAGELAHQSARILYPSVEAFDKTALGYEKLRSQEIYSDERIMMRKDGSLFWCNVSGKAVDPDNPQRTAIWIFQDISERKHAEEELQRANERLEQAIEERTAELRQANESLRAEIERRRVTEQALEVSREKYKALFESFPIGISITDEQGEVIEINQALSHNRSQAISAREMRAAGATVVRQDGSPIAKDQLPGMRALRERRAIHDVELGVRSMNGKTRWFSTTAAPIPVEGYGVVIAQVDITDRRRMEEQERRQRSELARVSRLNTMGEMAAALAHELGQPLSSVLNYLHGCQLRLDAGEQNLAVLRSGISQAIGDAERAGDIVKNIRQFVRQHEPKATPTDLNALIREMVTFLDFERRECKAQILMSLADLLPALSLDPLEIKQVIVNLVKNGLDASTELPEASRVLEISTKTVGRKWVEVSVSDRGKGIGKEDSSRIFDAFYSTKDNGMGLGLAICRSIVESHGGSLAAGDNSHGGATFTFRLPRQRFKS